MNLHDLKKQRQTIFDKNLPIYSNLLNKTVKRIKDCDKIGGTDFLCEIPKIVFGEPSYNQKFARDIIIKTLTNGGYNVIYVNESWVYINWVHLQSNHVNYFTNKKK